MNPEQLTQAALQASTAAARFSLPLRSRVWKGQAGEFSGAGTGSSLDFHDHRNYNPGDDPRHINWQAYARTGQYTMKLYREEVRPIVDLIMDASASMFFTQEKATRSAELLYLITESCARAGASLNIHLAHANLNRPLPLESITTLRWFTEVDKLTLSSNKLDDPGAPLDLSSIPTRANAIRLLISDVLFPGDPAAITRHLTQGQGSGIILSPFSKSESHPDWDGSYEFVDAERHSRHPHRIEPSVLKRYKNITFPSGNKTPNATKSPSPVSPPTKT